MPSSLLRPPLSFSEHGEGQVRHPLLVPALSLAVLLATVLQGSLLILLPPLLQPNLPLLSALCGAWMTGSARGGWLGFWAGLLMASLSGMFVGSYTFSYLIAGWLVGRIREDLYGDWPLIFPLIAGAGTLLASVIFFLWNPRHIGPPFSSLEQIGITLVTSFILYLSLSWLLRLLRLYIPS